MPARTFEQSTLWQISVFERSLAEPGDSSVQAFADSPTLPRQLQTAIALLGRRQRPLQALDVLAACVRLRVSALIVLRLRGLVWPLTLFPQHNLHHLPGAIIPPLGEGCRDLGVIAVEPATLRPPLGQGTSVSDGSGYAPVQPLLCGVAMNAPCSGLFAEISGRAAYRITADTSEAGLVGGVVKGPPEASARGICRAARHRRVAGDAARARRAPAQWRLSARWLARAAHAPGGTRAPLSAVTGPAGTRLARTGQESLMCTRHWWR